MTYSMSKHGRHGIENQINSLFSSMFADASACSDGSCNHAPAVDVRESNEEIILTCEMPGMIKDEIKVWVEDNTLTVSGERQSNTEEKDINYIRSEISSGSFNRSFKLPKYADTSNIAADYTNGLLVVKIARAEETKPKEIEINIS